MKELGSLGCCRCRKRIS